MCDIAMLSLSLQGHSNSGYIFDCSAIFSSWFFFLVVNPSLILAQTQVSAPLNSRSVIGYRKGGATPIQSPDWSSG